MGCLRLCRDGVNGRRAPRSSLFPHTTVGSAQRHKRLITKHNTERPRWRDGLSSAWRGAAASRRGNTRRSRIFTSSRRRRRHVGRLGATLASRNNRRCCANVFKKHGHDPRSRRPCPRPSRRPTREPQSRAKPRVTPLVTISDWRYLLRRHHVTTPALWAGRLPLKGFVLGSTGRVRRAVQASNDA